MIYVQVLFVRGVFEGAKKRLSEHAFYYTLWLAFRVPRCAWTIKLPRSRRIL